MATANDVLRIAAGQIGYSRWDDPEQGTKYGRWYAQSHGSYFAANGVAFCAMFASWVLAQAGQSFPGMPAAYVPYILRDGRNAGRDVPKTSARPGDLVIFQWDSGPVDHIGFVEINRGSYIQTIEGNTNNGRVARRTRSWGVVAAILRPAYNGAPAPSGGTSAPSTGGYADCTALQRVVGAVPDNIWGADTGKRVGAIQLASNYHGNRFPYDKAYLQSILGTPADGVFGPKSWAAHDKMVKRIQAIVGVTVDGVWGANTDAAVHRLHLASHHTV